MCSILRPASTRVAFRTWIGECYQTPCSPASYVVDLGTGSAQRVDESNGIAADDGSSYPRLSGDGQHVVFFSRATNLASGATTTHDRLYVRDLRLPSPTVVADDPVVNTWSSSISSDGQRVAYVDEAPTDPSGPFAGPQVYVFDATDNSRNAIVAGAGGAIPNGTVEWAKIAADGRTVMFYSYAWNLIAGDDNLGLPRIYAVGPKVPAPPPPPPPPPPAAASFVSLVPGRLMDSRSPGSATVDHAFEGVGLRAAGSVTELQVAGRGGVPVDAAAVVLNVTVTGAQGSGFVTVYPCGSPLPNASNLNYTTGATIPNAVITRIGAGGKVCLYTEGAAHLIADANGYYPA